MKKEATKPVQKEGYNTVQRSRKNSFERKCVDKSAKRLFARSSPSIKKLMNDVTKAARTLQYQIMSYNVADKGEKV